jgi:hypothetical protein
MQAVVKDGRSEPRLALLNLVSVQPSEPNYPADNCMTLNVSGNGFYCTTSDSNPRLPRVSRDYDVFEKFPYGSTHWRACVSGRYEAQRKLQELAEQNRSTNIALSALGSAAEIRNVVPNRLKSLFQLAGQAG